MNQNPFKNQSIFTPFEHALIYTISDEMMTYMIIYEISQTETINKLIVDMLY
jgi:hypothetical protein